jgi:hypothetical protein
MAQDEDLGILGTIPATAQHQQVDHEADKAIGVVVRGELRAVVTWSGSST